jgi:3-hydroxyisobutyrate dehydrogenase-like beta-hydroxyacid dehydrogenase
MTTVGFIGLGAMGLPMAKNLAAHGFTVRGFDMRTTAVDALPRPEVCQRLPPPRRHARPTSWC